LTEPDLNRAASHCPRCLAEYRPGFDTCADCGVALVPGPAPVTEEHAPDEVKGRRHPAHDREETPVVLCSLPQMEARILVGKLRGEGLVADVDPPALGLVYGTALPDARMLRVWVLGSQLDRAREVARRALGGEDAI
jgi:hypothetical protein